MCVYGWMVGGAQASECCGHIRNCVGQFESVNDLAGNGSRATAFEYYGGGTEGPWGYWGGWSEVLVAAVGLWVLCK
jgi:hypothetical protein